MDERELARFKKWWRSVAAPSTHMVSGHMAWQAWQAALASAATTERENDYQAIRRTLEWVWVKLSPEDQQFAQELLKRAHAEPAAHPSPSAPRDDDREVAG